MRKNNFKLGGGFWAALAAIIFAFVAVIGFVDFLLWRAETKQTEAEGQMQLVNIAARVDNSLYRSECLLDSVAMQVEQIIAMGGDVSGELDKYFCPKTVEKIRRQSGDNCFSAYAAYDNKLYINGFTPDDNFVLNERSWYIGAKKRMGAFNITEPYIDASTGEMCYSISKLLSDGSTVVGLDFDLGSVQQYIEEMNPNGSEISFIVDSGGMMVGHSVSEYVGRDYRDLALYNELVNKVYMLCGNSFTFNSGNVKYNVFSYKTNYDWYLAVCVKQRGTEALPGSDIMRISALMTAAAAAVVLLFVQISREKLKVEKALADKNAHLKNKSIEIKRSVSRLVNRADVLGASEIGTDMSDHAKELDGLLDDLVTGSCEQARPEKKRVKLGKSSVNYVIRIALVTVVLIATGAFSFISNVRTHGRLGSMKMENETKVYLDQVKEWALKNKTVLDVISESIAAQPGFSDDYASAVSYLDRIISQYDDISVAYICNPEWEHTVIMNNGWQPDDGWHVEERQWYVDSMASSENFNVSAPYLDEQTGLYCTTLSKIVYDENGNFIGILGIDFYLDKLIGILGESYTDLGYAFLTDVDGNILNHPNEEYQMKPGYSVNAADICYRPALSEIDNDYVNITDYDGRDAVCYAMKEEISGFNVFVVRGFFDVMGNAVSTSLIYFFVFAVCIIIVNVIMFGLAIWQSRVNGELKEAADKAISAGRAKNDFLANMSHEIRTPINAVLGMNEMIMRESGEKNILGYAANIQSSGRTLLSIINDILDFSKIESGKMEIVPGPYDVTSLVNDIVNMTRIRAEKKKLKFICDIDENIPSMLYGDDVRIRQVITNILTNAVKYTPEGCVRLRMRVLHIEDGVLRLGVSVTDTGIGIKEEDMDKLFASFQRLDQEKNRSIEGTGLGMSIVQRLLDMMGSELRVSSVYGSGSTFSFEIEQNIVKADPIGDFEQRFKAAAAEHTFDAVIRTAPDARVLVVDDNETNLLVAKSLLKRTRVKLDTAPSGAKCIELLKSGRYDIVFLDHMMPEMDGIETLKKIKEEQLASGTVFIALTANAIHGARQNYLDAGFDDYLSKPFTGMDIEKCLFGHIPAELCSEEMQTAEDKKEAAAGRSDKTEADTLFSPDAGAKYVGGDIKAYGEILSVYVRKAPELLQRIEKLYNEKDWKNYIIEVHALKSSSLNIGSKQLSELAKELELSGKAGNTAVIEEKNVELLALYKKVAALGGEYLEEYNIPKEDDLAENAELKEITEEKAEEYFSAIKEACLSFDSDEAERLCDEIKFCSLNGKPLKPVIDEIKAAAEDFEYEAAAEAAEKYSEKL